MNERWWATSDTSRQIRRCRDDELRLPHENELQVLFLGFGEADVQIGRILAEATGAEYQGSTDEDLATVIEELGAYF